MIIVSYDIANDKLRTRFSKFLSKFGFRLQYSVFKIKNSKRMLEVIKAEILNHFEKLFEQTDSVIMIETSETCKITNFGYAKNQESDIIVIE